jgi:hypothetical protein
MTIARPNVDLCRQRDTVRALKIYIKVLRGDAQRSSDQLPLFRKGSALDFVGL